MTEEVLGLANPLDRPIYGAKSFAIVLNRTVRQIYDDLENERLDAGKWGKVWVSTPRKLLRQLPLRDEREANNTEPLNAA